MKQNFADNVGIIKELINKSDLIIFDGDGTLFDTLKMWNSLDYQIVKARANTNVDYEEMSAFKNQFFANHFTGDIYLQLAEELIEKYHLALSSSEYDKLRDRLARIELESVKFTRGAGEFLSELKRAGKILCLATLSDNRVIDIYKRKNAALNSFGSFDFLFDFIITEDDITKKKPDPEIYNTVVDRFGIPKEKCLVFEDSLAGVKAATAAGIKVVNMREINNKSSHSEIDGLTDLFLYSFEDLQIEEPELFFV